MKLKKIILNIIIILLLILVGKIKAIELPLKTNHEKVKVYLFYSRGCPHCHEFIKYYLKIEEEYRDYISFLALEAFHNDNASLDIIVRDKLNINEQGVPLIVIGNFNKVGFVENYGAKLLDVALQEYQNENYQDIVNKISQENNLKVNIETLHQAAHSSNIIKEDEIEPSLKEENSNLNEEAKPIKSPKKNLKRKIIFLTSIFLIILGFILIIINNLFFKKTRENSLQKLEK